MAGTRSAPGLRWPLTWLLLAALHHAGAAEAHQRSESFSRWQWDGQTLEMQFTVSAREVTRLPLPAGARSPGQVLADYLAARVGPRAPEPGCRPARPLQPLAARPGYLRIAGSWRCPMPPYALALDAFFELAAEHVHFAGFESSDGLRQRLLTREGRVWRLPAEFDTRPGGRGSVFAAWLGNGVRHIGSGPDHLAFLLALLLLSRRPRDLVWAVTGFTAGHSITLSLAVLGLVQPHASAIEAVIGLTVALVAVERTTRRLPSALPLAAACAAFLLAVAVHAEVTGGGLGAFPLAGLALFTFCYLSLSRDHGDRGGFRFLITALFGLVHGFGFAGAFLVGGLEGDALWPALAGFNLGVEAGQLLLVGLLLGAGWLLQKRPALYLALGEVATVSICGLGVFWFLQRGVF